MSTPTQLQQFAAELGFAVPIEACERLLAYLDAMLDENTRINLTAVREREEAVLFHALDALAMAGLPCDNPIEKALDIGTGNGFPGVAIACLHPSAEVVLMDRTLKKLKAIERALQAAGFDSGRMTTVQMDAREAPAKGLKAAFDWITARAVTGPEAIGKLAEPLLAPHGRLLTWLSVETTAPDALTKRLQLQARFDYELPTHPPRQRHIAMYGWMSRKMRQAQSAVRQP